MTDEKPETSPITRMPWAEFQSSGMLWAVNRWLHMFGLTIVVEVDDDSGEVTDAYPARTSWRGFPRESDTRGFGRVSKFLRDNAGDL